MSPLYVKYLLCCVQSGTEICTLDEARFKIHVSLC